MGDSRALRMGQDPNNGKGLISTPRGKSFDNCLKFKQGYSLSSINNTPFSTHDRDNDGRSFDCAEGHRSGWWHGTYFYTGYNYCYYFHSGGTRVSCAYANPNGDYNGGVGQNIFDDNYYYDCNQKYTELKIRRRF